MNEKVLVIDDNMISCEALRALLSSAGFNADCCGNGHAALDLARSRQYTTFLINYHMPVLRGDDLTRMLRSTYPDAYIVGFSIAVKNDAFRHAGADIFVKTEDMVRKVVPFIKNRQRTEV